MIKRLGGLCAAVGLALATGACTDGYGYSGVSLGYGNGFYGDPYFDGYGYDGFGGYGGYGYGGYAPSYFGWYGDYYYPGAGVFVYDSYRRPYRWNGAQQRYWQARQRYRGRDWNGQGSWNGFDRRNWDRGDGRWQPGQRGFRDAARAEAYRRTRDGRGYRGDPGLRTPQGFRASEAPGYRPTPGLGSDGARAPRFQSGSRGSGPGRTFRGGSANVREQ